MNYADGILLVDKPKGLTSHDIVAYIRERFHIKKVGHAGTLDPMATGLLIILLGQFTKRSINFTNYEKEYEARLCLGVSTDTMDKEGRITEKIDLNTKPVHVKSIKKIFESFQGEIQQIPPMYSAKKIKGKKLYELARKGIEVKREPRVARISDIKVLDVSLPYVAFYVKCSKGTYIRQLAHDIGKKAGWGAHLVSLKRTKIGPFSVQDAVQLEALKSEKEFYENILQPERFSEIACAF